MNAPAPPPAPGDRLPGFILTGPTGIGKSAIGIEAARSIHGEIVNADPFQVYRGLDVLTAKPKAGERSAVPHHFFDCIPAAEPLDAARFADRIVPLIREIASRGSVPIVVGGSGLYLRALTHGLAPLPGARADLRTALGRLPLAVRAAWLTALDPASAAAVNLLNPRHVDRALEITLESGRPASEQRRNWADAPPRLPTVVLERPRDALYARINRRVESMVANGVVDEVAAFDRLHPDAASPRKAIGFEEFLAVARGRMAVGDAIAAVSQATRHYAKRQLAWFRREPDLVTVCLDEADDAMSAARRVLAAVRERLGPIPRNSPQE